MSSISTARSDSRGFTLAEMLIIAPMIILIITVFVAVLVNLTGDAMKITQKNRLAQQAQKASDTIATDVRLAQEFRELSFTPLTPQGAKNDTTAFDTKKSTPADVPPNGLGTTLILRLVATDRNPLDPARKIIYTNTPYACGSADENKNEPFFLDVVYYYRYDNPTYSLWRRIIHNPATTACGGAAAIWQRPSCAEGGVSGPCQTEDRKILSGIKQWFHFYPNIPDTSTPTVTDCLNPCMPEDVPNGVTLSNRLLPYSPSGLQARSFSLSFTLEETAGGEPITYRGSVYASRLE